MLVLEQLIKTTDSSGTITYRLPNGKLHRTDGPAIIYLDGGQFYYLNGKRHREDGPAAIHPDGFQSYAINGQFHREDGPAIIRSDGTQAYWINGIQLSKQAFVTQRMKKYDKEWRTSQ